MNKSYFFVKISDKPFKINGKLKRFPSLEKAYESMIDYLNAIGKTNSKDVKFVVDNHKFQTELSIPLVRDFIQDMAFLRSKNASSDRKRER